MSFNFYMPTKMICGNDSLTLHGNEMRTFGRRCIVVTGKNSAQNCGALKDLLSVLHNENINYVVFDEIRQNPLLSTCYHAGRHAIEFGAEFVVGIGGGSPLDAAKAVAVYAANPTLPQHDIYDGWSNKALPIVLIGTTAGTGSEVTPYSVLTRDDTGAKGSISGDDLYARIAYGDAKYTMSLSKHFTISTALDSISHCIESYFIKGADTVSKNFALEGLALGISTLKSIKNFEDITINQREKLYTASIYGGLAINKTGTTLCHLMSYPLSEERGVAHGYACSVFLPDFIEIAYKYDSRKAEKLSLHINMSRNELCNMISGYNSEVLPIKYDDTTLDRWVSRWSANRNIKKTAAPIDETLIRETAVKSLSRVAIF